MNPPSHDTVPGLQASIASSDGDQFHGIDAARLLPSITANSSVGMAVLSPDGRFEYVNPALCSMLACRAEDLEGRHWTQFTHPDHIDAEEALLAQMLAGRLPSFRRRKRYVSADGGTAWGDLHATYVDGDKPGRIVWQVVDISSEVALQELLTQRQRVAEDRYGRLFEQAPVGIFIADANGIYTDVNEAGCEMLQRSRDEILGKHILEMVTAEDGSHLEESFGRLATEGCDRGDWHFPLPDGSTLTGLVLSHRLTDGNYQAVVIDVGEKRRQDEALRKRQERLAMLANNVSDVVWTMDLETADFLYATPSIERLLGYTVDEVLAGAARDCIVEESRERAESAISEGIRKYTEGDRDSTQVVEIDWKRRDGTIVYTEVATRVVGDDSGRPHLLFGVSRDISTRKHAEQALRESNERLSRMLIGITTTLSKIVETRDPYTQGHEEGVARLSSHIAREMGLSETEIEGIELAALLHDIGKMAVPAEILTKPGRLTEIEHRLIRIHSQAGHDILRNIEFDWPIADIVLQHHERMDGSGYPEGLSGDDILPAARIIMAADVLEAMGAHRPYRPALGVSAAMDVITGNAHQFDPDVVAACVRLNESGVLAKLLDAN